MAWSRGAASWRVWRRGPSASGERGLDDAPPRVWLASSRVFLARRRAPVASSRTTPRVGRTDGKKSDEIRDGRVQAFPGATGGGPGRPCRRTAPLAMPMWFLHIRESDDDQGGRHAEGRNLRATAVCVVGGGRPGAVCGRGVHGLAEFLAEGASGGRWRSGSWRSTSPTSSGAGEAGQCRPIASCSGSSRSRVRSWGTRLSPRRQRRGAGSARVAGPSGGPRRAAPAGEWPRPATPRCPRRPSRDDLSHPRVVRVQPGDLRRGESAASTRRAV
jgi:hypothetical protein